MVQYHANFYKTFVGKTIVDFEYNKDLAILIFRFSDGSEAKIEAFCQGDSTPYFEII